MNWGVNCVITLSSYFDEPCCAYPSWWKPSEKVDIKYDKDHEEEVASKNLLILNE